MVVVPTAANAIANADEVAWGMTTGAPRKQTDAQQIDVLSSDTSEPPDI